MSTIPLWRAPATKVVRLTKSHVLVYHHDKLVAKRVGCAITLNTLNSGHSSTAIDRMNQFSAEFCSGAFYIIRRKNVWVVEQAGAALPLTDGLQFNI